MIKISEGNNKLKSTEEAAFLIFNLPARSTCPFATDICKKICYARDPQEIFKHVRENRRNNFVESRKENFVRDMVNTINLYLNKKKYINKKIYFRIHESGDFYSREYFEKWIEITNHFKNNGNIIFQAYTKSLPYFINYNLNDINIRFIYSILPDTKPTDIGKAKLMGLKLFIAKPLPEIQNNNFVCPMDCSNCKVCYDTSNIKEIYVVYHGARIAKKDKIKKPSKRYFSKEVI